MDTRKEKLLASIIKYYVNSARPVGSEVLVKCCRLNLSPATIRNEMKVLEKEGYIFQPHTSAGRIPTDKGYRYFVDTLMKEKQLNINEQRILQTELLKLKAEHNRMAKTMAKLLAHMSNSVALSGIINYESIWDFGMTELLKQPEFDQADKIGQIAMLLECIDENIDKLSKKTSDKNIDIYIGEENPLAKVEHCSMIISGIKFPSGEKGIIAVVGPKRMKYSKNISLIKYAKKLIGSILVVAMVFIVL